MHLGRIEDAHDAVARGLCLKGCNGDSLAHEEIHERALTHIGVAYDIDETGLKHKVRSHFFIVHLGSYPHFM